MADLLPCPFCNSDHISQEYGIDGKPYVSCVDCGANKDGMAGAWNRRAPAVQPQGVQVKPLVWEPYPNVALAGPDIAVANFDLFGVKTYQVQRDPWGPDFLAVISDGAGFFHWESKGHATLEAAKAAAQAHHDASILAHIDPDPMTLAAALALPEVKALVDAARDGLIGVLNKHETKGPLPDEALMFCWLAAQEERAVRRKMADDRS